MAKTQLTGASAHPAASSSAQTPPERTDSNRRTLAPFGRRSAEVVANEEVGAYRLISVADSRGPINPVPGQFYMLQTAASWGAIDRGRPFLPRAFSFARVRPGRGGVTLAFLLEEVGPGTARLATLRRGERLWLTGPLGRGFGLADDPRPLLVGGGIGVAPLLCWQEALDRRAQVLLGFRDAHHGRAASLFVRPRIATDDGSLGRHGPVTELLGEELERDSNVCVYACGPPAMLEAVRAMCGERQVEAQLALEAPMACGFGACYGCVVATTTGYARVCVDGPVMDAARLSPGLDSDDSGDL